jgi:CubicO group peptidase (beta-lactamase class C family)
MNIRSGLSPARLCAVLAGWTLVFSTYADQVDDCVERHLNRSNVPGLSLAVLKEGKVIKAKGYGLANLELNVPATTETVYQLASVTKQFTATAVMLLVEEGKVRLSDPISLHLKGLPAAWSNITVRHLLSMTSGIKDYLGVVQPAVAREDFTYERIVELVADLPLNFEPGERFQYSNSNYILLAMLIRSLSGKSYDNFLADRVWGPLGMTATRRDNPADVIPNRASLYNWRSNKFENIQFLSPTLWNNGDGGLVSTVLDLGRWDAALYTNRILSSASLEQMWSPQKLSNGEKSDYGFGWVTGQLRGHRMVIHGGGRPGTATQITRFIDDQLTVIVLMNGPGDPQRLAIQVAGQFIPGLTIDRLAAQKDPNPDLSSRLKECLLELASKKDSPLLTDEFRRNFSNSRRRFAALQKDTRDMKSFTFVTSESPSAPRRLGVPIERVCYYRLGTSEEPRFYAIELTKGNQVGWVDSAD